MVNIISKRIKGITIRLDGDTKGLDKSLQDVNKRSRDLNSELREVERGLRFTPGNTTLLAQQQELLAQQVENTSDKLDQLRRAQKQVEQQFKSGDIGEDQYRAFQRELVKTEDQLNTFEGKLQNSKKELKKFGDGFDKTRKKIGDTGRKMKDIGGNMTASITGPLLGGLALATKGTEEYRQNLARLETNAEQAGYSNEMISDALVRLSGVSDEADSNVEALSNLLATGFDETGLIQTMDALSGAVVKFPDTLKIEGLADGLQETLATGKAIGPFAEMLERMGIDLDTFNEGLATASKNGEAQNYVLETLANTGLSKVNEKYRENNQGLVESKEANQEFMQSMADLGEILAPIVTKITDFFTMLISKFNELDPSMQNIILVVSGFLLVLGPLITMVGMFSIAIGAISAPVLIVIGVITALIAIGVALYKNWDRIKEKAVEIWTSISDFFTEIWQWIKETFNNALDWIDEKTGGKFKSITDAIRKSMETAEQIIKDIWSYIKRTFNNAIDFVVGLVTGDFEKMKGAIEDQMENSKELIETIWGNVMDFLGGIDLFQIGKDIIQGLIDGVKSMALNVIESVKGVVEGAINGAMKLLGIKSPSRVFMEIGKNTGEGLEKGLKSMGGRVERASEEMTGEVVPDQQSVGVKNQSSGNNNMLNLEGLFSGANFNINNELDIEEVARMLGERMVDVARRKGIKTI